MPKSSAGGEMGTLGGWRPMLAALSVVLSALVGIATNVVTQSGTVALTVTVSGLVVLSAWLAWLESRGHTRPADMDGQDIDVRLMNNAQ